jgi:hypothetical protein
MLPQHQHSSGAVRHIAGLVFLMCQLLSCGSSATQQGLQQPWRPLGIVEQACSKTHCFGSMNVHCAAQTLWLFLLLFLVPTCFPSW